MLRDKIVSYIKKAIGGKGVLVETPQNEQFGDYSTNTALVSAKKGRKDPYEVAKFIKAKLESLVELQKLVEKIEIARPGFINFWLNKDVLVDNLIQINSSQEVYGKNQLLRGKRICVEYTDPNPFKEFHIGHLVSNVTGEAICRLYEACGAKVWRADYFGDVGVHAAKSIWGIQRKLKTDNLSLDNLARKDLLDRIFYMGQGYAMGSRAFDEDIKAKEEIGRLNTVLYIVCQKMWEKEGKKVIIDYDPERKITEAEVNQVYDLYVSGRKWSLEYFELIYKRLGTKFDGYYPESVVGEVGYQLVNDHIGKVFEKSEGAVIFKGEKFGFHTRVFINKHNLPTYEAKELGLAPSKYKDFSYDKSIIVVGKEIKEYFAVLVEALKQVEPKLGEVTIPICTGMVTVPSGKMGSRFGNVITVTSLIDQLKKLVLERMDNSLSENEKDEVAERVAQGALKYAFLKNSVGQDFVFDINSSVSLEGNSGPYLQYTYARTQSVLRKSERVKEQESKSSKLKAISLQPSALSFQPNDEEAKLLRSFVHFPEIVEMSAKNYSPNLLCNYLYDLASKFNLFYNKHKIIGSEEQGIRLAITAATGQILKNGLNLLGIEVPEKM